MADHADHAYAHAAAVLGDGLDAFEAALFAVRRGGRSRTAVLGHARAEVLARAADAAGPALDESAPDDLTDLAVALASTRPALERVVVDLDARHGLDRGRFARSLGVSPAAAGARITAVSLTWQQTLDPVLLARLGAGGCEGLGTILGDVHVHVDAAGDDPPPGVGPDGPRPLGELLALGPAVADHADGCEGCRDRLRSMVSVRTLLGQRPLEPAPASVRAAAAPSRLRRPSLPPLLEPESPRRRWPRPVASVALGAVAVAVAVVIGGLAVGDRSDEDSGAVEALTRVPETGSVLEAQPAAVDGPQPTAVRLTNRSAAPVAWVAVPDAAWLSVSPAEGRLEPGEAVSLRVILADHAPEGDVRASVQNSGRDGSATVVRATATIEHPPDVAATIEVCNVEATVEDEGEVEDVSLHWLEPASAAAARPVERSARLLANAGGYGASLPASTAALTWWVTAEDARGNRARTPDAILMPGSCLFEED